MKRDFIYILIICFLLGPVVHSTNEGTLSAWFKAIDWNFTGKDTATQIKFVENEILTDRVQANFFTFVPHALDTTDQIQTLLQGYPTGTTILIERSDGFISHASFDGVNWNEVQWSQISASASISSSHMNLYALNSENALYTVPAHLFLSAGS